MELDNLDPKQIKAMIALLSSMLPNTDEVEESEPEPVIKSRSSKAKKTGKKQVNLFDKMNTGALHKEDSEIDKKLLVKQPSPRMRDFSLISVTCRKCGKKEQVNPAIVIDKNRYKCNDCARTPG